MSDFIGFIGLMFGFFLLLFTPFIYGIWAYGGYSCSVYSKVTEREVKYENFVCYIKADDGGFIPDYEFQYRAITNERGVQ